ncbi:MAG: ankyrin repeat domain-containing protein [Candidatus Riflebacteria bacterium]|nr:ankyrin repeat domain-containing protein [Candidatus Riflebacteria bacterium]
MTVLHEYASRGETAKLEKALQYSSTAKLITKPIGNGFLPIHSAASSGNIDCIKVLLESGSDINSRTTCNGEDRTPLMISAMNGCVDALSFLLDVGADINSEDAEGNTALRWAIKKNQTAVVSILLHRGAKKPTIPHELEKLREMGF